MRHYAFRLIVLTTLIVLFLPAGCRAASSDTVRSESIRANNDSGIYLPLIGFNFAGLPTTGMISIPAGAFQMGCDTAHNGGNERYSDEIPLHSTYLDAFSIDRTQVTNAQ